MTDPQKEIHEREVTKEQFRDYYFQYATPDSGWSPENWHISFETEERMKYLFTPPATPESTMMFISSGQNEHRMYFLTEESTEAFFDFPGED